MDLTWHQPTRDFLNQVSRGPAMQPLSLTLKGFRGIRDGLGRDTLTLDFERLADGAQLIAIAGANGRGKTTVMDNMHPLC
jgi:exonuclease SbcC